MVFQGENLNGASTVCAWRFMPGPSDDKSGRPVGQIGLQIHPFFVNGNMGYGMPAARTRNKLTLYIKTNCNHSGQRAFGCRTPVLPNRMNR